MSVYVFDKGMAMYPLTKAMGGKHFMVAADGDQLSFCPLQYLETKADRSWAMDCLDTVLALNNVITTTAQRNEISNAIVSMYASGAKPSRSFR